MAVPRGTGKERLAHGIQHARAAAFLTQHSQRVSHEIRVAASAASNYVNRIPLRPNLSITAPEFELVCTATTSEIGYAIQSICIACGTLLS